MERRGTGKAKRNSICGMSDSIKSKIWIHSAKSPSMSVDYPMSLVCFVFLLLLLAPAGSAGYPGRGVPQVVGGRQDFPIRRMIEPLPWYVHHAGSLWGLVLPVAGFVRADGYFLVRGI